MKKYSLYAIGEIFLVVIGILIALQVNNWNQNKLQQNELQESFQKFRLDLENDVKKFNSLDSIYELRSENAIAIQLLLTQKNDISDIIKIRSKAKQERLANRDLSYNHSTYDAFVETGLLYTSVDKEINLSINEYYERIETFNEVFGKMGEANRNVRDQETMIPFRFITDTPDSVFDPHSSFLEWMNDHQHPTYIAVQTYLSFYVRQQKDKQNLLKTLSDLNESLQQLLNYK